MSETAAEYLHQGTEEWHADRAGCITASRMGDLIWTPGEVYKSGAKKGQPKPAPKARTTYIDQIVAEILTGQPKEQASAKSLDYGHEMEPEAIAAYECKTGHLVEQVGFLRHPDHDFIGASPDFLVDNDGGGEIKCPMSIVVHAATLREGLPPEHIEQIQGGLWVTGRLYWDFISYNPKFPDHLKLYVQRVHRDNEFIARLKRDCLSAWDEVQAIIFEMNRRAA
jgi:hypothetical protein